MCDIPTYIYIHVYLIFQRQSTLWFLFFRNRKHITYLLILLIVVYISSDLSVYFYS